MTTIDHNGNIYTIQPGADLSGADLTGADLTGARLSGANLTGANVDNVQWPMLGVIVTTKDS